jgi:hypothetical protein
LPTADPSLIPALITSGATLFTANWSVLLTGVIAIIVVVKLPALIASGVIRGAFGSIAKVLRLAK